MADQEEGLAFEKAMMAGAATKLKAHGWGTADMFAGFGDPARTEKRLASERKASKSPRQRSRKAIRTVQVNVRAAPSTKALMDALADKLGQSAADVFHEAIKAFGEQHGLKVDDYA